MRKVIPVESAENKKSRDLCSAARKGEIAVARRFLGDGVDVNSIDEGEGYATTPLESAIGGNQEEMMRFLIDEGADPGLEVQGGKSYHTCLGASDAPYEKRLRMIEILYKKKPEMAEEIAKYITGRISYLGREGLLDATINSEKSQAIIAELEQINQARLKQEQYLKELAEHARKILGLDNKTENRRNSSDETKSGSSAEEIDPDPNHKNPANKVKPNPSQSSPIVPVAANSGCIIS